MLEIPILYIKDKQAFKKEGSMLRLTGSPVELSKKYKKEGYKLIHIVDLDALAGFSTNLDIYNSLTYFINIEVECAPDDVMVKKLLSLKCRVVLPPSELDLSALREKKLLVGKISKPEADISEFHDVILEDADDAGIEKLKSSKKRLIVYRSDYEKLKDENKKLIWGTIEK